MEPELKHETEKRGFGWALLVGVLVVILAVAAVVFWTRSAGGPPAVEPLPFGPEEQAYAQRIAFRDIQMSRAENFLDQEVTYLFATLVNNGTRTVRQIEVVVEFRNTLDQVALRSTERLIPPSTPPVPPGQMREFQLSWEQFPGDWNRQYPAIRITGLLLE